MKTAIWWIRRDLRLGDNQALQSAAEQAGQVIPVFILDEKLLSSEFAGEKRLRFLYSGLRQLDVDLRQRGSQLSVRRGEPQAELNKLLHETGAEAVFAEPDHSPYAKQRDNRLSRALNLQWCGSPAILKPGIVLKPDGEPYTVFTPFSRKWRSLLSLPDSMKFTTPDHISSPSLPASEENQDFPNLDPIHGFPAGECEAQARLERFTGILFEPQGSGSPPIWDYQTGRDRLDTPGTSLLSPYLRFGMLSARQAAWSALRAIESAPSADARAGAETWLNELIWRDFYIQILEYFPHVRERNFRMEHIRWENDRRMFAAWKEGLTGYPVVDAAMRQLVQTGWMHNRARMISASFLSKDLLIDWRWGEAWFMQQLIDGDPAANNGGWQWTAGTGTDAAPYFRIFNPISQSKKFDPKGAYIRRWLPVLNRVPDDYIHQPWLMPAQLQQQTGVEIGKDYPAPVIDHAFARARALQAYKRA